MPWSGRAEPWSRKAILNAVHWLFGHTTADTSDPKLLDNNAFNRFSKAKDEKSVKDTWLRTAALRFTGNSVLQEIWLPNEGYNYLRTRGENRETN